jgi:hypothetical protein
MLGEVQELLNVLGAVEGKVEFCEDSKAFGSC